jgi:hypothetical protein
MDLMRRLKLFALAAFALLALGAASVPGASAEFKLEPKACDGTIPAFCWEAKEKGVGLQELVGTEEVKFTQEKTEDPLFEAKSGAATILHILCENAEGSGTTSQAEPLVKGPTLTKATITFKECKVLVPSVCKIEETQKTKEFEGSLPSTEDLLVKPAAKVFIEIKFEGPECAFKGLQPITGEGECLWLTPEVDEENKLCEFTHEDGGFKFGVNPASLLAEFEVLFPILEKEDVWDIGKA